MEINFIQQTYYSHFQVHTTLWLLEDSMLYDDFIVIIFFWYMYIQRFHY